MLLGLRAKIKEEEDFCYLGEWFGTLRLYNFVHITLGGHHIFYGAENNLSQLKQKIGTNLGKNIVRTGTPP